mgnify:CR=1 FL=1
MRWPDSEEERFSKKYEPEPNTGCWLWAGILYWERLRRVLFPGPAGVGPSGGIPHVSRSNSGRA